MLILPELTLKYPALLRLTDVDPLDVEAGFDYDKTMVNKDKKNPDHSPFLGHHYKGFKDFSTRVGRSIVLTARGELSVLGYFGENVPQHGRLENVTLASNSGHVWHKLDQPRYEDHHIIGLPRYSESQRITLVSQIHSLVTAVKSEFPVEVQAADQRELCGAVVAQFLGTTETSDRYKYFCDRAKKLKDALPKEIGDNIIYEPNFWNVAANGTPAVVNGYIDMKPAGMSKGITSRILFEKYANEIVARGGKPFAIFAGDSDPDGDAMEAIDEIFAPDERLFIAVGTGLNQRNEAFAQDHGGAQLLDIVLESNQKEKDGKMVDIEGETAVDKLHEIIAHLGHPNVVPRRSFVSRVLARLTS